MGWASPRRGEKIMGSQTRGEEDSERRDGVNGKVGEGDREEGKTGETLLFLVLTSQ